MHYAIYHEAQARWRYHTFCRPVELSRVPGVMCSGVMRVFPADVIITLQMAELESLSRACALIEHAEDVQRGAGTLRQKQATTREASSESSTCKIA